MERRSIDPDHMITKSPEWSTVTNITVHILLCRIVSRQEQVRMFNSR